MGVSSLLFHGDSRTQAIWPAKHVYLLSHFNGSHPQKSELNTILMAGRSLSPPRANPGTTSCSRMQIHKCYWKLIAKFISGLQGCWACKGTSCFRVVGLGLGRDTHFRGRGGI